jgi:hypothetical protein
MLGDATWQLNGLLSRAAFSVVNVTFPSRVSRISETKFLEVHRGHFHTPPFHDVVFAKSTQLPLYKYEHVKFEASDPHSWKYTPPSSVAHTAGDDIG